MASSNDPTPSTTETRKRQRTRSPAPPLLAPELPSPTQTSSTPEAGSSPSQSSVEMGDDSVPEVDGNARKRRKIHLVLVPEREIKEEEAEFTSLFNSIVDCPSSPPAEANACVSTPPPRTRPSAQETQQPTPPASRHSDTPPSQLPPAIERTPPPTRLCDTTTAPTLVTLSWPAEIVDAETYALAAASTQALIDHYLQEVARLVGFNKEPVVQSATK
ncbi:hypothetical protein C8R46DRAFT_1224062 [Mycena filopes]|nr:hypothetical protein C8R46DRAFT_1224062 [Mycena filopes]